MGVQTRPATLPRVALYLSIASACVIGIGLGVGLAGTLAAELWRPAGLALTGLGLLAIALAPILAIAAVVTGHVSRRRYPAERAGRTGLIVGYSVVGTMFLLAMVGVTTWQSIR